MPMKNKTPEDAQVTEDLILSLCIARRISPSGLERLAVRLSHLEAILDAQTDIGDHHDF
jgi:hypothetical protein